MTIHDISIPIHGRMPVWPGDPAVEIMISADVEAGDLATVRRLALGSHTGTHVDAFSHFKPGGQTLDAMALAPYLGPALVVEIPVETRAITAAVLSVLPCWHSTSQPVERILLKTANSLTRWWEEPFNEQFVHLTPDAADFLVTQGVRLVGIDYLSVEGFGVENAPVHHRLLDAGVYILEGLYLGKTPAGWHELLCLPLPLQDGDGAPARAVLRPLGL